MGVFPSLLATHRGWNKHMHLFKVWSLLWTLPFQLWFSVNSFRKSGQGSKPTTCCYQDTTKPKWSKGLPTACFQLPRKPHKDIQSIMTFVYGWRTQNTTPSYHFYGSLDMTVFSKQYRRALSTSNVSILTNFYQNFLWKTRSCPQEVRSYGLHLC